MLARPLEGRPLRERSTRPLRGIRVIDLTVDRAELGGRLLSDLGADVIKVEPPSGSPSRSLPPLDPANDQHSLSFTMRNCGKRSVVLKLAGSDQSSADSTRFELLLADADVLIDSAEPGAWAAVGRSDLEAETIADRHRHLVVASVTSYGRTGPYAGRDVPGSVLDATSGMCWKAGLPEQEPLFPPGDISGDSAGLMAGFAVVCALIQHHGHGAGQLIDVSANEAAAQLTDWSMSNVSRVIAAGIDPVEIRAGTGPVYTIIAAKDGFVRPVVLSPRQWHAMRAWMGEPDFLQDPEYDGFMGRLMIAESVLNPLYEELFSDMTMEQVSKEAQHRGIVATPVLKPGDILTNRHFESRGTFDRVPLRTGGVMSLPSGWLEIDGTRLGPTGRPPEIGEHTEEVLGELAKPAERDTATEFGGLVERVVSSGLGVEPSPPLAGVRVADFGHGGVGVEMARLLAEYGADVVKVESRAYPDFIRVVLGGEMSPSFASSSRSKRSLGVNAKTDEGRRLLLDLVASGYDVVIENGSTGTMDELGLGYRDFASVNPSVVMVSSQLMGSTGEWSDWLGYGPNSQAAGGLTHLWDYPDAARPSGSQSIFPDHWAGRMGALAAVAGLLGRRRGVMTSGCHFEVCQVEQVVGVMGDLLAQESLRPGSVAPQGNRRDRGVPWGLFRCSGEDQWVAVCCRNDAEWVSLAALMGVEDPGLSDAVARLARIDEVEQLVSAWTEGMKKHEVAEACLAAGVPAGPMLTSREQLVDPHLQGRGYLATLDQPPIGEMTLEGAAFHATGMIGPDIRPAPGLGAHTLEIAAELGLTDTEIQHLIDRGVLETDRR